MMLISPTDDRVLIDRPEAFSNSALLCCCASIGEDLDKDNVVAPRPEHGSRGWKLWLNENRRRL